MFEDLSLEESVMGEEKFKENGRMIFYHYYKKTMKNKHENVFSNERKE